MERFLIIGGDKRQYYLAKTLEERGYHVNCINVPGMELSYEGQKSEAIKSENIEEETLEDILLDRDLCIVLPVPVTVDGKTIKQEVNRKAMELRWLYDRLHQGQTVYGGILFPQLLEVCEVKNVICHDLMKEECVILKNAVATAEGTIAEAILLGQETIHGKNCLVIGYGNCGSVLADKLKGFGGKVSVMARRESMCVKAETLGYEAFDIGEEKNWNLGEYDYIFNTVPTMVLTKNRLAACKKNVVIIDIASKPGGTDFVYCEECGIAAKLVLGIPGKYAPKTSGIILADAIERNILKKKPER